ncbi:MAG TPA: non-canonical purine NTP pyrophosphatase [Verrucomicrobiae bacterium]|nr:non-canonical purine NTP pyrophosphatase [Verrucomicrobiae bacterium]
MSEIIFCAPFRCWYRARVTTLLIATRNTHKVGEIRAILGGQFQFLTLNDFPKAPEVIEDADTFAGNATKKAVELAKWLASGSTVQRFNNSTILILADDSGLEVDALDGKPGVHSARFTALDRSADGSSANSPDADNNAKLLRLMKDIPLEKRAARFRCVIALATLLKNENENTSPVCFANELESPTQLFDGACAGKILFEPRGKNGFGYDPLFVPNGFDQTFAELGDEVKNKLSHRAKALEKLKIYFSKLPS